MSNGILRFGSGFEYRERNYVYLTHTEEIIYSALILDSPMSDMFKDKFKRLCIKKSSPEIAKLLSSKVYCFVELRTEEFKNRVAHFAKTQGDVSSDYLPSPIGQLDKEDLKQIKKEIEDGPVPLELKDKIKSIVIE